MAAARNTLGCAVLPERTPVAARISAQWPTQIDLVGIAPVPLEDEVASSWPVLATVTSARRQHTGRQWRLLLPSL